MGKPTGFMEFDRELPGSEKPEERVKNYREFYLPFEEEKSREQAGRCMNCGVPFCHSGCPLGNVIPEFNDAVYQKDWAYAIQILLSTNNFPEFTGRICPAPCEGSCVLGINKPPVAIEHIEKTIIEKAYELGYIQPQPPAQRSGKKVAVIGSGPSGLAAAAQLNQAGHQVVVFERAEKPGGLLRFGIPDFKLEKSVVERRVRLMEAEGIEFRCNTNVGVDVSVESLKSDFDAIVLCGGSTIARDLPIPGRDAQGVHLAMDFLSQQNRRVSGLPLKKEKLSAKGKQVVVIGGGDTGSDCVGTSHRHGATSVTQIELLSKPPTDRKENNPWPEWPMILRTSSSHDEGGERKWSILTKEFVKDKKGALKALKTIEIEWPEGQRGFVEVPGTEKEIPCELALLAVGFLHPQKAGLLEQLGVELDGRGNVKATHHQTSVSGVFAAGDMRRGQSLVVWAISEGREAARAVDTWLMGESKLPAKDLSYLKVG